MEYFEIIMYIITFHYISHTLAPIPLAYRQKNYSGFIFSQKSTTFLTLSLLPNLCLLKASFRSKHMICAP